MQKSAKPNNPFHFLCYFANYLLQFSITNSSFLLEEIHQSQCQFRKQSDIVLSYYLMEVLCKSKSRLLPFYIVQFLLLHGNLFGGQSKLFWFILLWKLCRVLGRTESYGEVSEGYDFPQKRSLISWKDFLESGPREYMEYSK